MCEHTYEYVENIQPSPKQYKAQLYIHTINNQNTKYRS